MAGRRVQPLKSSHGEGLVRSGENRPGQEASNGMRIGGGRRGVLSCLGRGFPLSGRSTAPCRLHSLSTNESDENSCKRFRAWRPESMPKASVNSGCDTRLACRWRDKRSVWCSTSCPPPQSGGSGSRLEHSLRAPLRLVDTRSHRRAARFWRFWWSGWNIFDFIVVAIGLLTTANVPLPGPPLGQGCPWRELPHAGAPWGGAQPSSFASLAPCWRLVCVCV